MTPLNCCTREAAQRLQAAGIVIEADFYWVEDSDGWRIIHKPSPYFYNQMKDDIVPALQWAEVWRELPENIQQIRCVPIMWREGDIHYVSYMRDFRVKSRYFRNTNPTDALIDLLIWVKKEKP